MGESEHHIVKKKDLVSVVNAVLEATGCRELCRQCVVKHKGYYGDGRSRGTKKLILNSKSYGNSLGGCCGPQYAARQPSWGDYKRCSHLRKNGCGLKSRPFGCVVATCDPIGKRLAEFGLVGWVKSLRKRVYYQPANPCAAPRLLYHEEMRHKTKCRIVYISDHEKYELWTA